MKNILFVILLSPLLLAQESVVRWSGTYRLRTEADGRDFDLGSSPNLYTLSRLRLSADIHPAANVRIFGTIQDARRFGEEATTSSNNKNLDLYEGYVVLDSLLLANLTVQAGRMQLACGSDRVLGISNWGNIGRAFDGFSLLYRWNGTKIGVIAADLSDPSLIPDPVNLPNTAYKRDNGAILTGGYLTTPLWTELPATVYGLHEANHNRTIPGADDLQRTTIGARIAGAIGSEFVEADVALQSGTKEGKKIAAWMAVLGIGERFRDGFVSSASLSIEFISGTKPGSSTVGTFTAPYANYHRLHGIMDYFINFPVQTAEHGLIDMNVRTILTPVDASEVSIALHRFTAQQPVLSGEPVKAFGDELDVIGAYRYSGNIAFELGLTAFVPEELMRTTFGGSDIGYWSYGSMVVSF